MSQELIEYELDHKVTFKQRKWIDEYIRCDDYATATIKAGYNSKNPKNLGYQNYRRLKKFVAKRKEELNKQITSDRVATLTEIQEFWTKMYTDELIKDSDRLKASELLAKSKGGFIEHVEVRKVDTDWFIEDDKDNG